MTVITSAEGNTEELELLDRISGVCADMVKIVERERRGIRNEGMYNGDDDVLCGVAEVMAELCERLVELRSDVEDDDVQ